MPRVAKFLVLAVAVALLAAAVAVSPGGARPVGTAAAVCRTTEKSAVWPLITAERKITRNARWQAMNLCCVPQTCTWQDAVTLAPMTANVRRGKTNVNLWIVRVPHHVCYVTQRRSGAAYAYTPKCLFVP